MLRGRSHTPKNAENTVFVRFIPASPDIRRHHLEDLFSQVGPIKKSSVILQSETSAYGFVKYTTAEDAALASVRCNNQHLPGLAKIRVQVETAQPQPDQRGSATSSVLDVKKTNRLILRNLSFYAKDKDIHEALKHFGDISDVHIPTVKQGRNALSRGFGFVTFSTKSAALRCLNSHEKIIIRDRPVEIEYAQHKTAYEQQKKSRTADEMKRGKIKEQSDTLDTQRNDELLREADDQSDGSERDDQIDGGDSSDDDENSGIESHSSGSNCKTSDDESASNDDSEPSNKNTQEQDRSAVAEQRCLFVRNIPFDATRHDLFQCFKAFGRITSIYMVRDKASGAARGTAFVSFKEAEDARKVTERGINGPVESIMLNGRELLIDLAVDKDTAGALSVGSGKATNKDRRNMYLLTEGRVDNDESTGKMDWDELPESDKSRRQSAWSDKNTKLRSPIFFINPFRLSIRNLSKTIDEAALKKLFVEATERGLRLVTTEDLVAHWNATGSMSTKEILAHLKNPVSIIPPFDRSNIKQNIPSVFIQRDFTNGKDRATSRGFGFAEFKHHAHALACLRELNNNIRYSSEFAAGGKAAIEANKKRKTGRDPIPIPRLIVEFTVENKVKAKQQAERRAEQMANKEKQKIENKPKSKNKKQRGAMQRERKRKNREASGTDNSIQNEGEGNGGEIAAPSCVQSNTDQEAKPMMKKMKRPRKKVKTDTEDANFSKLVQSYKKQAISHTENSGSRSKTRWFD